MAVKSRAAVGCSYLNSSEIQYFFKKVYNVPAFNRKFWLRFAKLSCNILSTCLIVVLLRQGIGYIKFPHLYFNILCFGRIPLCFELLKCFPLLTQLFIVVQRYFRLHPNFTQSLTRKQTLFHYLDHCMKMIELGECDY